MSEEYDISKKLHKHKSGKDACFWPLCTEAGSKFITVKVAPNLTLEGASTAGEGIDLPFCRYHFFIMMGGEFTCIPELTTDEDEKGVIESIKLKGPFNRVSLIEQVMVAREMTKK